MDLQHELYSQHQTENLQWHRKQSPPSRFSRFSSIFIDATWMKTKFQQFHRTLRNMKGLPLRDPQTSATLKPVHRWCFWFLQPESHSFTSTNQEKWVQTPVRYLVKVHLLVFCSCCNLHWVTLILLCSLKLGWKVYSFPSRCSRCEEVLSPERSRPRRLSTTELNVFSI